MRTGFWWENVKEREKLEKARCKWEDNVKMGLEEVGWKGMNLSHSAEDIGKPL
jgi:hypothetical protein